MMIQTIIVMIVSPERLSFPPANESPSHLMIDGKVCALAPKSKSATF